MEEPEDVRLLLEKSTDPRIPAPVLEEILSQVAALNGTEIGFYTLMREYHRSRSRALSFALSSLAARVPPEERSILEEKNEAASLRRLQRILCRLAEGSEDGRVRGIRSFLKQAEAGSLPERTALCLAVVLGRRGRRLRPSPPVD
jgi:hypothetical protein